MTYYSQSENDTNALAILLKKTAPFKELTSREINSLLTILEKTACKKEDIILSEGEIGTTAYIVAEGGFFW